MGGLYDLPPALVLRAHQQQAAWPDESREKVTQVYDNFPGGFVFRTAGLSSPWRLSGCPLLRCRGRPRQVSLYASLFQPLLQTASVPPRPTQKHAETENSRRGRKFCPLNSCRRGCASPFRTWRHRRTLRVSHGRLARLADWPRKARRRHRPPIGRSESKERSRFIGSACHECVKTATSPVSELWPWPESARGPPL